MDARPKVCLGMPVLQVVPGREFYSHLRVAGELTVVADWICPPALNMTPYSNARNAIMERAVEQECDLVYFVDIDNRVPAGAFNRLWAMMQESAAAVVAGYYSKRCYPFGPTWLGDWGSRWADDKPVPLLGCGMGCTLIDLKWLQEHVDPYPPLEHQSPGREPRVRWFEEPPGGGTEDYPFCRKVLAAGGVVVGHPQVVCGHKVEAPPVTAANEELYRRLCEMPVADG